MKIVSFLSVMWWEDLNEGLWLKHIWSGADLGGWAGRVGALLSGIWTPADSKGPPFVLFWDIHFWWRTKKFSKGAFGTNIYLFWEGSARWKSAIFWSKFSKKCLKTPFLACFFKILPTPLKTHTPRENPRSAPVFDFKKTKIKHL